MRERLQRLERYPEYRGLGHPLNVLATPHGPWPTGAGVILTAHCTDAAVNRALPGFLEIFPTPESAHDKTVDDLVSYLPGISHSGRKAQYLIAWARYLVGRRGDLEPAIEALRRVRGIGRKSAALILYGTKGIDAGMPLDTHALRVLERLGWFPPARNPAIREKQLLAVVTEGHRNRLFLALTHHGRRVCRALNPRCGHCRLPAECHAVHQNLSAKPATPT
jgi:endonuclease III